MSPYKYLLGALLVVVAVVSTVSAISAHISDEVQDVIHVCISFGDDDDEGDDERKGKGEDKEQNNRKGKINVVGPEGKCKKKEVAAHIPLVSDSPAGPELFVNANIVSSGVITSGNSITVDGIADTITSSSGAIGFGDEDLSTSGGVDAGGYTQGGSATLSNDISGNAATATALAANGANCAAESYPLGVDEFGSVEDCGTDISGNAATATALAANGTNCGPSQFAQGVDEMGNAEGCAGDISGNAATATSLAANGANCAAGQFPGGVDAQGNAEDCTTGASLTEVEIETFVTNGPLDLAAGTTVGGTPIATSPQNVLVASPSGGDFTSIQAALDSVTDASATNPYLVKVGPGVYNEKVTMKPFVDIEGSGELTTRIVSSSADGTVVGADDAELRFLAVENTNSARAVAIRNTSASPRLTHLSVTALGGSSRNVGVENLSSSSPLMNYVSVVASGGSVNVGVENNASSPTMDHVTATVSGGGNNFGVINLNSSSPTMNSIIATVSNGGNNTGVRNNLSSPKMSHVTATATGGGFNVGVDNSSSTTTMDHVTATATGGSSNNFGALNSSTSTVTINHSRLTGSTNSVRNVSPATTRVGASQLNGSVSGPVTCVASYGGSFQALNSSCAVGP